MKIQGLDGELDPVSLYISEEKEAEGGSERVIWFVGSDGKPIQFVNGNMGVVVPTKIYPKKLHWTDIFKP